MKKQILYLVAIVQFVFAFSQDSPANKLSLEEVIAMTLKQNFDIRTAKINADIAQNNNTIGNAGMLPLIGAASVYDISIRDSRAEFFSGATQEIDGAESRNFNIGSTLAWTLFDGTRMFVMKNRLQNEAVQQYMAYKMEVDTRIAQVMQLYYATALETERRELFKSNLTFSEERVRIVNQTYEVGKASKLDLLQAKVDYNTDQTLLIQQQELLLSQKLSLMRAIGLNMEADFDIEFEVNIDSTLQLPDLLQAALAQNPNILMQQYAVTVAEQQAMEISRARFPVIDLNAGYLFSNLNSEAGFLLRNQASGFNYGLSARVNVFDGLNQKRQVQNARLQAETSQIAVENVMNQVTTEIMAMYNTYTNNLYLKRIEAENLEVALENADIALERFKIGVSNNLQLREAQVNAVNAQIRYIQSQFNAKQAEIELKRLAGLLSVITD